MMIGIGMPIIQASKPFIARLHCNCVRLTNDARDRRFPRMGRVLTAPPPAM
jgi:hypothetical protein